MTATLPQPVPKNLREQMIHRLGSASEADVLIVHDALLQAEKLRLLDEVSRDADLEEAAGKWEKLPELIQEVRAKKRGQ